MGLLVGLMISYKTCDCQIVFMQEDEVFLFLKNMTNIVSHRSGKLKINIEFNAALSQANFQSPYIFQYLTWCLNIVLFLILTSEVCFLSNTLFSDSCHTLVSRKIHTFPPRVLVFPGTEAHFSVPGPYTHIPMAGVGCPCPRSALLWFGVALDQAAMKTAMSAMNSHEKPCCRHSSFFLRSNI